MRTYEQLQHYGYLAVPLPLGVNRPLSSWHPGPFLLYLSYLEISHQQFCDHFCLDFSSICCKVWHRTIDRGTVTIDTMLNFDGDVDGMCNQTFSLAISSSAPTCITIILGSFRGHLELLQNYCNIWMGYTELYLWHSHQAAASEPIKSIDADAWRLVWISFKGHFTKWNRSKRDT